MTSCQKPLGDQSFLELVDCAVLQSTWLLARLFQSYVQVFSDPGNASFVDWGVFLGSVLGAMYLIAKALAGVHR